jgi:flagellar P-ring protein precursor FlgI
LKSIKIISFLFLFILIPYMIAATPTVRIKDIATVLGVRENQLLGIGLVTGLNGKGDSTSSVLLKRTIANVMANFGLYIDEADIKSKNCAVVMISAEVPSFIRPGERIDVQVSSIGDATSLEGGILLQTNLLAANGLVYAVAQGKIVVPIIGNVPKTTASIPNGAIIEREVLSQYVIDGQISLILNEPDFYTASAVASAIIEAYEDIQVNTQDASLIQITIPEERTGDIVSFIGEIEQLTVQPDTSGKVVIDSQTGIIIMGENVRIGKVFVSYKDISVTVGVPSIFQEENPNHFIIEETTSVNDFIKTLTTVGIETEVIIEILKAIEKAGALYGELIIM